jgi:hypothetical protein
VSQRRFAYPLLVLVWFHYGHVASRHIPIFLVIAAPGVAVALAKMIEAARTARLPGWTSRGAAGFQEITGEFRRMESIPRLHLVTVAILIIVIAASYSPDASERFRVDFSSKNFPTEAVAKMEEMGIAGNVLSTDEWSDYLIYRLYPDVQVYFDGRFDFYGYEATKDFAVLADAGRGWENRLWRYPLEAALLPVDGSLAAALRKLPRWTVVYKDEVAAIFRPVYLLEDSAEESSIATDSGKDRGLRAEGQTTRGSQSGSQTSI